MEFKNRLSATPRLRFPEFENNEAWKIHTLENLENLGWVQLGRGEVISNKDIKSIPGKYPIYSSSIKNDGLMGHYGRFMFDEELITWSIDGGGHFFYRPKHKFSVTNVAGYMRLNSGSLNYIFVVNQLHLLHASHTFDYQFKAHPSVIRKLYKLAIPTTVAEQQKIAECLSTLDELIEAESRKLDALKDHKKGLMQQLFPREGETRPRLRFPEFRSSPDWTTRRMNEIYAFLANNSFSRDRLNYVSGSIKNIHYGDIHKHYRLLFDVTREVVPYINDDALTSESQPVFCAEGDMVFADASEDLEDIGKCIEIVNLNNERVVAGLHTILARPKTRSAFARGFSGYLFSSKRIRAQIQKESQGTKVLGISAKRLANIELCFPVHVAEQERIADCLSSLDDLIAAQSERLEALRAHKRGLMQQLFPNPSEFES